MYIKELKYKVKKVATINYQKMPSHNVKGFYVQFLRGDTHPASITQPSFRPHLKIEHKIL